MNKCVKRAISLAITSLFVVTSISAREITEEDIPRINPNNYTIGEFEGESPYFQKLGELVESDASEEEAAAFLAEWEANRDSDFYDFCAMGAIDSALVENDNSELEFDSNGYFTYYDSERDLSVNFYENDYILNLEEFVNGMDYLKIGIEQHSNNLDLWAAAFEYLAMTYHIEALKDYIINFVEFYEYTLDSGYTWYNRSGDLSDEEMASMVQEMMFTTLYDFIMSSPNPTALIELAQYLDSKHPDSSLLYAIMGTATAFDENGTYEEAKVLLEYAYELDNTNFDVVPLLVLISKFNEDTDSYNKWIKIGYASNDEEIIDAIESIMEN